MSTCYIVGAGEFYGKLAPCDGDLIIAADGGYDTLKAMGITPDLLLGDMDSLTELPEGIEKLTYPVRKDDTDTFLAYREGVRRGYTDFVIYGGVGGRDDHTFANYSLLIYAKKQGHTVKLVGKLCDIFALNNESITLRGEKKKHFSAFAWGGECKGVTLKGLEYEVEDISLSPDFPLAVSNRFTDGDAFVEVKDGVLLVMIEARG